jgi:hypothetical protein
MAGVALAKGLNMVLLPSASFNTYAGLTLSVDTVRACRAEGDEVFSVRDRTW